MNDGLGNTRPPVILLVEDNDNDVELTRLGFEKSKIAVNLHVVNDGEECMAFLGKLGQYSDAPTPDLILLDLNMPKMDGRAVLVAMSNDQHLRRLPIVILTTSADEQEILKMYELGCSSYIVKPIDFKHFQRVISTIADYWFTVVILPNSQKRVSVRP